MHKPEFRGRKLKMTVLEVMEPSETALQYTLVLSARELLKLPLEERDRILSAQAALAEQIYRNDPELTAFEAFGLDDLFDEYPEDAFFS